MKLRTMRIIVMCLTAAVLGAAISGCSTLSVSGSGSLEVMLPSIDGFTELAVDDNIVQYVIIEETGDRLRLGLDPDRDYRDVTLEASITMPRLAGIALSGASSLSVSRSGTLPYEANLPVILSGASTLRLPPTSVGQATFNLRGASTLDLRKLSAGNVDMRLDGASRLFYRGTVTLGTVSISGGSQLQPF